MLQNKVAIASLSLGQHSTHRLDEKIRIAAQHGFQGIEVVYSDLETFSQAHDMSMPQGARAVKEICHELDVDVLSLAPFEDFEGSNRPLEERLNQARRWIDLAVLLGATYLQVPAQFDEACRNNRDVIVSDLQQLADIAASVQPRILIAYEPMSWSVHNSTWEEALATINNVNRDNFGMCLDSFHILTKLWASPFDPSGKFPNAEQQLATSLERFKEQCPLDRLFYVQLSDAELFDPPFSRSHPWYVEGEAPEFTWSKHARPFPLESDFGGYTPVKQFLQACVADKGFAGWVSMEIFDRRMRSEMFNPEVAAKRGKISWDRLCAPTGPSKANL